MSVKMVRAHLSFADEHRGDGQHHMGDLYIHFLVELALMQTIESHHLVPKVQHGFQKTNVSRAPQVFRLLSLFPQ